MPGLTDTALSWEASFKDKASDAFGAMKKLFLEGWHTITQTFTSGSESMIISEKDLLKGLDEAHGTISSFNRSASRLRSDMMQGFGSDLRDLENDLRSLADAGMLSSQGAMAMSKGFVESGGGIEKFRDELVNIAGESEKQFGRAVMSLVEMFPGEQMSRQMYKSITEAIAEAGDPKVFKEFHEAMFGKMDEKILAAWEKASPKARLAMVADIAVTGLETTSPLKRLGEGAQAIFTGLVGKMPKWAQALVGGFGGAMGKVGGMLKGVGGLALRGFGKIGLAMKTMFASLGPYALLAEALGPVAEALKNLLMPLLVPLQDALLNVVAALQPLISALLPVVKSVLDAFRPIFDLLANLGASADGIAGPLMDMVSMVTDALLPIIQAIADALKPIIPLLVTLFGAVVDLIKPFMPLIKQVLPQLIKLAGALVEILLLVLIPVIKMLTPIIGFLVKVLMFLLKPIEWVATALKGFADWLANSWLGRLFGAGDTDHKKESQVAIPEPLPLAEPPPPEPVVLMPSLPEPPPPEPRVVMTPAVEVIMPVPTPSARATEATAEQTEAAVERQEQDVQARFLSISPLQQLADRLGRLFAASEGEEEPDMVAAIEGLKDTIWETARFQRLDPEALLTINRVTHEESMFGRSEYA